MEEQKYVLILGAGLMQKTAIEAAKNIGYKTIVTDANPDAVCVPFADRFEKIDLKDKEKIAELALEYKDNLAAVFTCGTDFSASVAYVAEKAGLKGHSYEAAMNASNKTLMRECFRKAGVSSPDFTQINRNQIASYLLPGKLDSMEFPKVIKPVDNMGARGCRKIRNKSEFIPAVEDAVRNSRTSGAILEDYMEGEEYSIDALVYNNTLTITGFADRHIYYEPYFIEMGHTIPSSVSEEKKLELAECFAKGVAALGLTCGAAKADIKYTKNGPMIGEIAARLSGGYMSGWTYPYASNFPLTEQALLIACGKEPVELLNKRKPLAVKNSPLGVYEIECSRTSAERAWISIPGEIQKIYGYKKLSAVPYMKNLLPRTEEGIAVVFPRNNVEKCGNIITCAKERYLAADYARFCCSEIVLRLKTDNKATDQFLSGLELHSEENFPPDAFQIETEIKEKLAESFKKDDVIKENESTVTLIPAILKKYSDNLKDYNYRTIRQTLMLFDEINPKHPELNCIEFWKYLLRGGIQGILYYSDKAAAKNKKRFYR